MVTNGAQTLMRGVGRLFHEDQPVVVLGAGVVGDDVDGEAVAAGGGVDVDAGGFHGGAGFAGVFAVLEGALIAEVAGAGAEGEGLVVSGEEDLALEIGDDLCDGAPLDVARAVEEQGGLIAVEEGAGLLGGGGVGT